MDLDRFLRDEAGVLHFSRWLKLTLYRCTSHSTQQSAVEKKLKEYQHSGARTRSSALPSDPDKSN